MGQAFGAVQLALSACVRGMTERIQVVETGKAAGTSGEGAFRGAAAMSGMAEWVLTEPRHHLPQPFSAPARRKPGAVLPRLGVVQSEVNQSRTASLLFVITEWHVFLWH